MRGDRAVVLEPTDKGEMIVLKQGRRSMQLAWTHLLPSTFNGAARMNVANALAAAGAAFAAGAPLHDIRQGLRTFTTSYYLSPGRLNRIEVDHAEVFVDYCHNPAGLQLLGEFVDRYVAGKNKSTRVQRTVVVGAAGDRRDQDIREMGELAAKWFDHVIIREDDNLRRRAPGETAALVAEGAQQAIDSGEARAASVETVLDELEATQVAIDSARAGDLVVICADKHARVMAALEDLTHLATPGAHADEAAHPGDPDFSRDAVFESPEDDVIDELLPSS